MTTMRIYNKDLYKLASIITQLNGESVNAHSIGLIILFTSLKMRIKQ